MDVLPWKNSILSAGLAESLEKKTTLLGAEKTKALEKKTLLGADRTQSLEIMHFWVQRGQNHWKNSTFGCREEWINEATTVTVPVTVL